MSSKRLTLIAGVCACWSNGAIAQATPTPESLPKVFVTATRTPQPVASLLSDVRAIDAEQIAAAGQSTLTELLQSQAGIEIVANGGAGQPSGVFLRGTNTNHVVVLVDGVRINSATSGTTAFENIPLSEIDRIEILRGPASSLYGADAIGGVIQIFTKQGGDRFAASAGIGTWRTERYAASVARDFGSTRLSVQAGYVDSLSFPATNEHNAFLFNPERDPYRNKNAGLNVSHDWAAGHTLTARVLVSEGDTHFDSSPTTQDVNRQRLSTYAVESRDTFGSWQSSLRVARGTDDSTITGLFPGTFRTDQDQATSQNDLALPGGTATAGLEYRRERVDSTTTYTQTSRDIRSIFAGYSGGFDAHLLQVSGRHDDNSQFGGVDTGNLAYGYRITPELRLTAGVGNAFKAPSFNDLYFSSAFFSGNPNLKPERAHSYELAAYYDGKGQRAGLTWYENRIHDLIAVDPTFTTVVNVDQARIRGGTAYYGADVAGYRVRAEVTHHDPIDLATGKQLVRRAKDFGNVTVDKDVGQWTLGGELVASGPRFDAAENSEASRMGGYALLNLRASYTLWRNFSLAVRWNNVLDKMYELARGYNTPRSNGFVEIRYTSP
jgi:vitamin B12 transporter